MRLSTVGDCAFPVAAARVWNSLPATVTSSPSLLTIQDTTQDGTVRSFVAAATSDTCFFFLFRIARTSLSRYPFCKVSSKSLTLCHLNIFV